jgi:hypothetical protein
LLVHIATVRSIVPASAAKAAAVLLNEYRSGKLGRISLERV